MKILLLLGLLALLLGSFFLKPREDDIFMNYQSEWGKRYENEEIAEYRRMIFNQNAARIEAHNATPGVTYTEAINQFTDLTGEEFESQYLGLLEVNTTPKQSQDVSVNADYIDWIAKGAVPRVKDQGACGSCWAFSAVANLENLNFLFGSKKMEFFSEQQLVDCSKPYGNQGCRGGLMTSAYKFVQEKGMVTEDKYQYVARDQQCKIPTGPFKIKSFTEIKNCNDQVAHLQKQTVAVAADASRWSSYSKGIFSNCGTSLNHGITLVTYGHDEETKADFWRIKNSWGVRWGENGFMRLKFGNTCGLCNMSCVPNDPIWA